MTDRSKKVSELPVHLNAPADNLLPIVANPATANAETRKISLQNLFANVSTPVRINSTFRATGNSTFNGNINVDGDVTGTGNTSIVAGQDSFIKIVSSDNGKSIYVNTTSAYIQSGNTSLFTINDGAITFPANTSLNTINFHRGNIQSNINGGITFDTTEAGSGQYIILSYGNSNNPSQNTSLRVGASQLSFYAGNYAWEFVYTGITNLPGRVNANTFSGNGSLLTTINAASISTGTLDTARLPAVANIATAVNIGTGLSINEFRISVGNSTVNSTITANGFVGVGEYITYINASNITDGTLTTDRLPATINVATSVNISDQVAINTSSFSITNGANSAVVNTSGVYIGGQKIKDTANLTVTNTTIASNTDVVITSNNGASTWTFGADGDLTIPDGKTIRLFSGDPALTPIGPFANDAVAAEYGVLLGNMYYTADGVVHIRLV